MQSRAAASGHLSLFSTFLLQKVVKYPHRLPVGGISGYHRQQDGWPCAPVTQGTGLVLRNGAAGPWAQPWMWASAGWLLTVGPGLQKCLATFLFCNFGQVMPVAPSSPGIVRVRPLQRMPRTWSAGPVISGQHTLAPPPSASLL